MSICIACYVQVKPFAGYCGWMISVALFVFDQWHKMLNGIVCSRFENIKTHATQVYVTLVECSFNGTVIQDESVALHDMWNAKN